MKAHINDCFSFFWILKDSDSIDSILDQKMYQVGMLHIFYHSIMEDLEDIDRIFVNQLNNEFLRDKYHTFFCLGSRNKELDILDKLHSLSLVCLQDNHIFLKQRYKLKEKHKYHILEWMDSNSLDICKEGKCCCKRKEHLWGRYISK